MKSRIGLSIKQRLQSPERVLFLLLLFFFHLGKLLIFTIMLARISKY